MNNYIRWYMYGTDLLYKMNISKPEASWIDNPTDDDKAKYLAHYKVRNDVSYTGSGIMVQ